MYRLVTAQFEEFADALRGVQGHLVLRSKPERDWRLRVVDLQGLSVTLGQAGAASIFSGASTPGYFHFFVPLSRPEEIAFDGNPFDRRKVAWLAPNHTFHIDSRRPPKWLSAMISRAQVGSWLSCHEGDVSPIQLNRNLLKIAQCSVSKLVRTIHRVIQSKCEHPDSRNHPEADRAARIEVLDAVFEALLPLDDARTVGRPVINRARILEAALSLIASMSDEQVYTVDLCRAAGVSERTLRNVFYAHFGMAPHRYLMVVRLHRAHAAILAAGPGDTISSICANCGLWDIGRFATHYRQLFGALPSQHLARLHASTPRAV